MQSVSTAYKASMKSALRERGYLTVYMGVVNLEAQKGAHVKPQEVHPVSGLTQPFSGQIPDKIYAFPEQDFSKVDGSMYFQPEVSEGYYNQGILSEEIKGAVTIYFDGEYDLHGMTILFGECYPTEFVVQTAEGETHYSNTAPEWVTSDVFQSVTWVRIVPSSMVNGNGRLRILKFTCGTSLTIPVNKIQNYSMTDVVSPVTESLPTQDMKLEVVNVDRTYDVDDENSIINFFEKGQSLQAVFSYDVAGDGILEYTAPQTFYFKGADATEIKATISATDRLQVMDGTYYKGRYYSNGISLYELAKDVLEDAGLQENEYRIDSYLQDVMVYNPLPVCGHKEALQIIANAGRCVILFNRSGQIQLKSSFIPHVTATEENGESWSNVGGVLTSAEKGWYASPEYAPVTDDVYFVPETAEISVNTGFVSIMATPDGTFSAEPVIILTMESAYTCFGLSIAFRDIFPEEIQIETYLDGNAVESVTENPDSINYATLHEFKEFDSMRIRILKGQPNRRIMVEQIRFGDATDYILTAERDLMSVPKAIKQNRIQAMEITRTIYSQSTDKKELSAEEGVIPDADGNYTVYLSNASYGYELDCDVAAIEESSCWYVKLHTSAASFNYALTGYEYAVSENIYRVPHNPTGIVKSWKNELVSSAEHAEAIEKWLAAHFMAAMEYDISYRGDPRVDAHDLFELELNRGTTQVRAYSHTLKYNGAWSGTMKVREINGVD